LKCHTFTARAPLCHSFDTLLLFRLKQPGRQRSSTATYLCSQFWHCKNHTLRLVVVDAKSTDPVPWYLSQLAQPKYIRYHKPGTWCEIKFHRSANHLQMHINVLRTTRGRVLSQLLCFRRRKSQLIQMGLHNTAQRKHKIGRVGPCRSSLKETGLCSW